MWTVDRQCKSIRYSSGSMRPVCIYLPTAHAKAFPSHIIISSHTYHMYVHICWVERLGWGQRQDSRPFKCTSESLRQGSTLADHDEIEAMWRRWVIVGNFFWAYVFACPRLWDYFEWVSNCGGGTACWCLAREQYSSNWQWWWSHSCISWTTVCIPTGHRSLASILLPIGSLELYSTYSTSPYAKPF